MTRKFYLILSITMVFIFGCVGFGIRSYCNSTEREVDSTKELFPDGQVDFTEFGASNFTCTGMTFDEKNETFWIADYGKISVNDKLYPRLIEVSSDFSMILSVIELKKMADDLFNLQGIAYDKEDDAFWIAVGERLIEIDKTGREIYDICIKDFSNFHANGVAVDDNYLWVLCYKEKLLKIDKEGNIEKEYFFDYSDQDMICLCDGKIYCTVGADYRGDNNYVYVFDPRTEIIDCTYKVVGSHSVEGIVIQDGIMFIANDGRFHNDIIGKSYINRYKLP